MTDLYLVAVLWIPAPSSFALTFSSPFPLFSESPSPSPSPLSPPSPPPHRLPLSTVYMASTDGPSILQELLGLLM